jgi:hypothetical protein
LSVATRVEFVGAVVWRAAEQLCGRGDECFREDIIFVLYVNSSA